MKALIFAAGIGSRLKPYTLHHPKALAEVGGKPLLQHVVERLRDEGGIREMVVNVHHFPDQIRDFIAANANFGIDVQFSDESSELLDTGGGLLKAWELLDPAPDDAILLHNADILTDFPIAEFVDNHIHSGRDVSLLVQRRQSSRMLWLDKNARLRGWQNMNSGECRPSGFIPASSAMEARAFGGVHIVSTSVLPYLRAYADTHGEVFSTIPFYLDSLAELRIGGFEPADTYRWFDIGSEEKLRAARAAW